MTRCHDRGQKSEGAGWIPRLPLGRLVHAERWERPLDSHWPLLAQALATEGA